VLSNRIYSVAAVAGFHSAWFHTGTWPALWKPDSPVPPQQIGCDSMVRAMEAIATIAPDIWRHAVDTFGTAEKAMRWMRQPLAELEERTPEKALLEHQDNAVEAILTRIDYGVYG